MAQHMEELYSQLRAEGLAEVERMARRHLRRRPPLNEFVMAMGICFFTPVVGNKIVTPFEAGMHDLSEFLDNWDERLCLTGEPMRFTANGPIVRDW